MRFTWSAKAIQTKITYYMWCYHFVCLSPHSRSAEGWCMFCNDGALVIWDKLLSAHNKWASICKQISNDKKRRERGVRKMARFPEDRTKMFLWDYFDWCQLFLLFRSNFFQSNKYLKTSYLLSVNFTPRPSELQVQNTTLEIHTGSICSSPAARFEKCHPKPSLFLVVLFFQVLGRCFNLQYLYLAFCL